MPSRNLMTMVMAALALLLSPVLLLVAVLFGAAILMRVAAPLCLGLAAGTGGGIGACANCYPGFCVAAVAIFLFIILPAALLLLRSYLKRQRLP